jgi:hypothetical protein
MICSGNKLPALVCFSLQDLFKKSKENHISLPSTSGAKDLHGTSDTESDNSSTPSPKKRFASSKTSKGLSKDRVSILYQPYNYACM